MAKRTKAAAARATSTAADTSHASEPASEASADEAVSDTGEGEEFDHFTVLDEGVTIRGKPHAVGDKLKLKVGRARELTDGGVRLSRAG